MSWDDIDFIMQNAPQIFPEITAWTSASARDPSSWEPWQQQTSPTRQYNIIDPLTTIGGKGGQQFSILPIPDVVPIGTGGNTLAQQTWPNNSFVDSIVKFLGQGALQAQNNAFTGQPNPDPFAGNSRYPDPFNFDPNSNGGQTINNFFNTIGQGLSNLNPVKAIGDWLDDKMMFLLIMMIASRNN